tara:strand:- start:45 stop:470 length:426 start_codon:yes stop_codon:yes gene_type:complete
MTYQCDNCDKSSEIQYAVCDCYAAPPAWREITESSTQLLPADSSERKTYPLYSGVLQYFPHALIAVAHQSWLGSQQHRPGKEVHWDKSKSSDELDALMRHMAEGEWAAVAWRALAHLEREMEKGYDPVGERQPTQSTTISK